MPREALYGCRGQRPHRWVIEPANGNTMLEGFCVRCQQTRLFPAATPEEQEGSQARKAQWGRRAFPPKGTQGVF